MENVALVLKGMTRRFGQLVDRVCGREHATANARACEVGRASPDLSAVALGASTIRDVDIRRRELGVTEIESFLAGPLPPATTFPPAEVCRRHREWLDREAGGGPGDVVWPGLFRDSVR